MRQACDARVQDGMTERNPLKEEPGSVCAERESGTVLREQAVQSDYLGSNPGWGTVWLGILEQVLSSLNFSFFICEMAVLIAPILQIIAGMSEVMHTSIMHIPKCSVTFTVIISIIISARYWVV